MEAVIFDVLGKLAPGKSASSEEVARAADNENWRRLTGHVRNTARGLARQGKIVITRHGKPVLELVRPHAARKPVDVHALRRLTDRQPKQRESAGTFVHRLREDARY